MNGNGPGPHPATKEEYEGQLRGFEQVTELVEGARTIAVCAHTSPDGDALGSELAMAEILRARWGDKEVVTLLADNADVPRIYRFLPGAGQLVRPDQYDETPDLFIAVDLSTPHRLGEAQDVLERATHTACLDHHPCDKPLGDACVVRPSAAAAGVIVAEFAMYLEVDLTQSMSQSLMCALMTDTGRFQYQNTDAEALETASLLVSCGADPSEVSLNVYQSFRLQYLHLKSLVMGRITTFEKGKIAYSYATRNDLERTGADLDECDGLIDVVRSVEGSEVALFLKMVPGDKVRGNLRAKGDHDISKVARAMGGGGHRAAAGFTYDGDIDEALAAVLPHLKRLVCEDSEGASAGHEAL